MLDKILKILWVIGGAVCNIGSSIIMIVGGFANLIGLVFNYIGKGCEWIGVKLRNTGDYLMLDCPSEIQKSEPEA